LIALIILITVHELSHLIASKLCKCKVMVFSLGFGKYGLKIKTKNTTYKITPFLVGGYCELEGEFELSNSPTAFMNLRYYKKFLIAIAGCLANIILGLILYYISLKINNYSLWYIGVLNITAGISNLIPVPGLDGSYPILVLLEKLIGKKRSIPILKKIITFFTWLFTVLTIIVLPWFLMKGLPLINEISKYYWGIIKWK